MTRQDQKPNNQSHSCRSMAQRDQNFSGYTLLELVLTLVLLGAISTVLLPFFNAITHGPDPELRARAVALGQALMDEIQSKRWDQNSPMGGRPLITMESPAPNGTSCEPCDGNRLYCFSCRNPGYIPGTASTVLGNDGASRADFDDVDDYNGLDETDTFTDQNGNLFAMTGYRRQVRVLYITSATNSIDQDTPAAPGTSDTKLIIVTITSPLNETTRLIGISCNL